MIDLALSNKRELITDFGVISRTDKESEIKITKKLERVKSMKRPKTINIYE